MAKCQIPLIPPGEILLEECLKPWGVTPCRLARDVGVQQRRIDKFVARTRHV